MLTRALKANHVPLQDVTKQLLIWALNKKREFNTPVKDSNIYSLEDDDDRSSSKKFIPRQRYNKNWDYDSLGNGRWNRNQWNNRNFKYNRFPTRKWDISEFPKKTEKFTFNKELKPYVKDFYKPHPDVLNRSADEIKEFYKKHNIQLFGSKKKKFPPPIFNFHELSVPDQTLNLIRNLDYSSPTPVQSVTWPVALSGYNTVGVSRTGSGKTLAFILPAMIHIRQQVPLENGEGPIALIIAPTRELGQQIMNVIKPFARTFSLRAASFFGGHGKERQLYEFGRGAEICVATPGRLADIIYDGSINLSRCTYFVLDEADRLLDMGFNPQIAEIMHYTREDKQILMWSATWPEEVWQLAETYLNDYAAVKFGSLKLEPNPNITQIIHVCQEREKHDLLQNILQGILKSENKKILIFARTKSRVDNIGYYLNSKGFKVLTIHGSKSQHHRDKTMNLFRSGAVDILVGTLVVGRGLDIDNIGTVINFDFPDNLEDYVHIIGRTGRGEKTGTAHSFFTNLNVSCARKLVKLLESTNQKVSTELREMSF